MVTEFLLVPRARNRVDVVDDLRHNVEKYRHYEVQYAYVVDAHNNFGVFCDLRDLLLSSSPATNSRADDSTSDECGR